MFNKVGLRVLKPVPFSAVEAAVFEMITATPAVLIVPGFDEIQKRQFPDRTELIVHSPHTWGEDGAIFRVYNAPGFQELPTGTIIGVDMTVDPEIFLGQLGRGDAWDLLSMGDEARYHIIYVMCLAQYFLGIAEMELVELELPTAFLEPNVLARRGGRKLYLSDLCRVATNISDRLEAIGGNEPQMLYLTVLQEGFQNCPTISTFRRECSRTLFRMLCGESELPFLALPV